MNRELPAESREVPWAADLFNRKPLADYLTSAIASHVSPVADENMRSITVAVDADWGAGKTFFVREWMRDIAMLGHPVVYFDAWANDIGDEPSVALMSTILQGLSEWKEKLPKKKSISNKVESLTKKSIKNLRAAILPATGVIAKGFLKKMSGVAVDELVSVFSGEKDVGEKEESNEKLVGDALDKFFEKALLNHETRQSSLNTFRQSVLDILEVLSEHAGAKFPFFVFIDELDRCRPSYAIKLLEEVKHIFGIVGVAYVVSTNIDQLQNSVRGAYGGDFDGRRYLRRLFDKEYTLPNPTQKQQLSFAMAGLSHLESRNICTGLPTDSKYSAASAWSLIAEVMFPSDVRTQLQVLSLAREVQAAMGDSVRIHVLWIFYLCALYTTNRNALDQIVSGDIGGRGNDTFVQSTLKKDAKIAYFDPGDDPFGRDKKEISVELSKVIAEYMTLSSLRPRAIHERAYGQNRNSYPRSLANQVADDMQGIQRGIQTPISAYASIVRNAGYLSPELAEQI